MPAKPIYILNGPNLNLLGLREPEIYGHQTLADAERLAGDKAKALGLSVDFRQTNHEGELIDWIQEAREAASGIILNGGAYTHTSIALHDALKAFAGPIVELHVSNPLARERFRRHSYVSQVATGVICGLGVPGYALAVEAMASLLAAQKTVKP
jgi:3-dehydroquinate dehydratase-2